MKMANPKLDEDLNRNPVSAIRSAPAKAATPNCSREKIPSRAILTTMPTGSEKRRSAENAPTSEAPVVLCS
jgi:hypothetical protein